MRSNHSMCGCKVPPSLFFILLFHNELIMFREDGLAVENRLKEIRAIPHRSIDVTLEKRVWTRVPVELDPYFTGFSDPKDFCFGQVEYLL